MNIDLTAPALRTKEKTTLDGVAEDQLRGLKQLFLGVSDVSDLMEISVIKFAEPVKEIYRHRLANAIIQAFPHLAKSKALTFEALDFQPKIFKPTEIENLRGYWTDDVMRLQFMSMHTILTEDIAAAFLEFRTNAFADQYLGILKDRSKNFDRDATRQHISAANIGASGVAAGENAPIAKSEEINPLEPSGKEIDTTIQTEEEQPASIGKAV
jgi:hypothetical protein